MHYLNEVAFHGAQLNLAAIEHEGLLSKKDKIFFSGYMT